MGYHINYNKSKAHYELISPSNHVVATSDNSRDLALLKQDMR
jgi:hypothetical protein